MLRMCIIIDAFSPRHLQFWPIPYPTSTAQNLCCSSFLWGRLVKQATWWQHRNSHLVNPQIYWSFHGFCLWPGNFQAIFAWISPPKTNRGTIVIGFDVSFRGLSTNPQSHDPSHRTHLSILSRSTMRFPALGGCCGDGGRAGHSGHPNWGWWLDKYDQIWLLVGGLEHGFYFSTCIYIYIYIYWE